MKMVAFQHKLLIGAALLATVHTFAINTQQKYEPTPLCTR